MNQAPPPGVARSQARVILSAKREESPKMDTAEFSLPGWGRFGRTDRDHWKHDAATCFTFPREVHDPDVPQCRIDRADGAHGHRPPSANTLLYIGYCHVSSILRAGAQQRDAAAWFLREEQKTLPMNWFGEKNGKGIECRVMLLSPLLAVIVKGSGAMSIDLWLTPMT